MVVFNAFGSTDLNLLVLEEDDHCSDFFEGLGSGQIFYAQRDFYINDVLVSFLDG